MRVVEIVTYKKLKVGDVFRIKRCHNLGTYIKRERYFEDINNKKLAYRPLYNNTLVEKIELWLLFQFGYLAFYCFFH